MAKKIEVELLNQNEVTTTISIPIGIKNDCKKKGIGFKRCFLIGYNKLVNGEIDQTKENNKKLLELEQGNLKLQRKLTELSLKVFDLEAKNGK